MRNRIVSFEYVSPSDLDGHPQNWRTHPNTQRSALQEVLDRVGVADALLVYRSQATGRLTIVDGHLRRELLAGEGKLPVLVLDLTDEEAKAVLTSHDPIGAMAQRDQALYETILNELGQSDAYADMVKMLDVDRHATGADGEDGDDPFKLNGPATHEIVPIYDEGYDAVIITSATEGQWAQLQTILNLPQRRDRKGRVGITHVITAEEFFKLWKSK